MGQIIYLGKKKPSVLENVTLTFAMLSVSINYDNYQYVNYKEKLSQNNGSVCHNLQLSALKEEKLAMQMFTESD